LEIQNPNPRVRSKEVGSASDLAPSQKRGYSHLPCKINISGTK
jgi:hypothetical protein